MKEAPRQAQSQPPPRDRIANNVTPPAPEGPAHGNQEGAIDSISEAAPQPSISSMFTRDGERKYLSLKERAQFIRTAETAPIDIRTFCLVLAYSGCRISEGLALCEGSIDFFEEQVVIHSLKKRGRLAFRGVPLPPALLDTLKKGIRTGVLGRDRLWPWSRMTGYRRVCEVMEAAGVRGGYATPRGLRHSFAVCAVQSQVPLNMVQRWLGHADIKTTAIYTNAMGPEEREIASRMWRMPPR